MPTRSLLSGWLLFGALLSPAARSSAEEPAAPATAPAPVADVAAPVPAAATADESAVTTAALNREIRERYANRNWRLGSFGGFAGSLDLQRRFWIRSGLSVSFFGAKGHEFGRNGYDMGGLAFGWWREHTNRLFPVVWGWNLSAGPMVSSYFVPVSSKEEDGIADAFGAAGAVSLYAIVPVFSMLFDAAPHGLIPYLTLGWSLYGGVVGPYRVTWTKDLNGDGVNEYTEGDPFRDPGGKTHRSVGGVAGNLGAVWIW